MAKELTILDKAVRVKGEQESEDVFGDDATVRDDFTIGAAKMKWVLEIANVRRSKENAAVRTNSQACVNRIRMTKIVAAVVWKIVPVRAVERTILYVRFGLG